MRVNAATVDEGAIATGSGALIEKREVRRGARHLLIRRIGLSALLLGAAALAMVPFVSAAYETVTINGNLYACQHSCDVTFHRDGGYSVRDSKGGWAARIEPVAARWSSSPHPSRKV